MDVFSPNANAFRFYDDDAGEAASTPLANQDTNVSINVDGGNVAFQLRYRVQNTTAVAGATTDDYELQRSPNAGAYATITGATLAVITSTSGLTNDNATTNRATNGITDGTGVFVAGEQCTDGVLDNHQLTASNFVEHVWGGTVVAADLSNGDTIDFRVSLNGGAPGMTNSVTPRITIQKSITGTGALASQAAAADGTGTSGSTGTGALSAQAASVDGTGQAAWVGTGALAAQAASVDGAGTSASTGTGAPASQAASVDGTGVSASTGTGALSAQTTAVDGAGISSSTGTGALAAQAAAVDGAGVSASTGSGALASAGATVSGVGTVAGGAAVVIPSGTRPGLAPIFARVPLVCTADAIRSKDEWGAATATVIVPAEAAAFAEIEIWGEAAAELLPLECAATAIEDEDWGAWRGARQPPRHELYMTLLDSRPSAGPWDRRQ